MSKRHNLSYDTSRAWAEPDRPVMPVFRSVDDVAKRLKPEGPVECIFPEAVRNQARRFLTKFPGQVLYAVKCNPNPEMLRHMYAAGIRRFDVASLEEVRLIRRLFDDAELHFMHPVKSREAIRAAYKMGVKTYSLDSASELTKILEETNAAKDLELFIRLAVGRTDAAYDLSGKFGAPPGAAADLLRQARKVARKLGVCFHVGSQCMAPDGFRAAIARASAVIAKSKVKVDVLDVGGGFPAEYPGMTPPPLEDYFAVIAQAAQPLTEQGAELWCEPGRAMVAKGASMLVRVMLRKGRRLYINDGTYGSLFDAGTLGWRYPVRVVRSRPTASPSEKMVPYVFYGPTCDTLDKMKGPFLLPDDIQEGDWMEVATLGAYGAAMQTSFNGFHAETVATVWPEAMVGACVRRGLTLVSSSGVPASVQEIKQSPKLNHRGGALPIE